ncbi:MAG: hypothetical protein M3256_03165 [Actinomycetota bacterium]|nr:hypothetical protein [Actinomycetota bacterium]
MATIEFVKRLAPVRGLFHAAELTRELGASSLDFLVRMTNRRDSQIAYLDGPIDQVTAQLNGAMARILGSLDYSEVGWSSEEQVAVIPRSPLPVALVAVNSVIGRKFFVTADGDERVRYKVQATRDNPQVSREIEIELGGLVESGIDSLQINLARRWRRLMRAAAAIVSAVAAFGLTAISHAGWGFILTAVSASLVLGGFFAWFARDIVASIESLRR